MKPARLINSVVVAVAILLLGGCDTPRGVTPKPDIRPVQETHERAQASVGRARKQVGQLRQSQGRASDALRKATESLNRYTGANTAVEDTRKQLGVVQKEFEQSRQYGEWAAQELDKAWAYEAEAGKAIETLSGQIDTAHKHEEELAGQVQKWEPIIKQVNSYWGLGAFAYGAKVLARHLFILSIILVVVGGLLWFLVPAAIPFIRMIMSFIGRIFRTIGSIFRR